MKQAIILLSLLLIASCSTATKCETVECMKAQAEIEAQKLESQRAYELERKKIEAQIEANKPVQVKVAEIQAEEISVWEAAIWAAAIWGGIWLFGKMLDNTY